MDIVIDDEFRSLIPPLSTEERQQLECNLIADGCRDPLVIWKGKNILLDGHNRYEICEECNIDFDTTKLKFDDRNEAQIWIIKNQFGRRNITNFVRAELALKLKPKIAEKAKQNEKLGGKGSQKSANHKIDTREELASIADVSHDTIAKVEKIVEKADDNTKQKLRSGEISINAAHKDIKKAERTKEIAESRQETARKAAKIPKDKRYTLKCCDFREYKGKKKFDYIITDPPYPKEFLPLYSELGKSASRLLVDGGLLIAMCGQSYLEQIYGLLRQQLDYYWTACYLTPGQPTPLRQVNVNTTWKPLLMFTKRGDKYNSKIFGDVFTSDANDKAHHKWGQSISGMSAIVQGICEPGKTIFDPFVGAGTTGIAAIKHGCLFAGCDIEQENVDIAKARISEACND